MFETPIVAFTPGPGHVDLKGALILVDADDYEGIHIAVGNLAVDLERVTGTKSDIVHGTTDSTEGKVEDRAEVAILVGSLERCRYFRNVSLAEAASVGQVAGKWESFVTSCVETEAVPGLAGLGRLANTLFVIAGSDKRGAIFGTYTLTEQIGVSPWHWWADVPVKRHAQVYALPRTTVHGEPSVRFRGFFINDEAPALTSWVHATFGPKYNAEFYRTVFELLLRLKANFLWPAMWSGYPQPGSSFFVDDPRNQQLADTYGIVMSTSHHEPMQRSTTEWFARDGDGGVAENEWSWNTNKANIKTFFKEGVERAAPYESFLTLGMRGAGDSGIVADKPLETLQDVVNTQRQIIQDCHGPGKAPHQLIALYKEVQEHYENGLQVPDDVTLLFADDNFGTIRRLPTEEERKRSGGAGIYYHVEYVGHPRSCKWLNTTSCGKLYSQFRAAYDRGAQMVWVVNVGDIKPQELPLTFVMAMAWDMSKFATPGCVSSFFEAYAGRFFSQEGEEEEESKMAAEIAGILQDHDSLLALRRHEHIDADTFSLLHYDEAETIVQRFARLEARAVALMGAMHPPSRAAFFQLVLHPIKASSIYVALRVAQAKNQLYGRQRRNSTNTLARRVLDLFDQDFALAEQYHGEGEGEGGGKWKHMMRQPHYGYVDDTWHDPSRDLVTGLCYVQRRQDSNPAVGFVGVAVEGHAGVRPGLINEESDRTQPSRGDLVPGLTLPRMCPYGPARRSFDVFLRGTKSAGWAVAKVGYDWVQISPSSGSLTVGRDGNDNENEDQRVHVSIDWDRVPAGFDGTVAIDIVSTRGDVEQVHLPVVQRSVPAALVARKDRSRMFVESDGYVSIDVGAVLPLPPHYEHHPFLGRTGCGAVALADALHEREAEEGEEGENKQNDKIAFLEYPVYLFSETAPRITLYFTLALDTNPRPGHLLRYDIGLDDELHTSTRLLDDPATVGDLPPGWSEAVQDGVWKRTHTFGLGHATPGLHHTVKYRPLTHGVMLEKVVVDLGGVRESYLGPPASMSV